MLVANLRFGQPLEGCKHYKCHDISWQLICHFEWYHLVQLEQLERLRSEDTPPPPHDYPYYWVILNPMSEEDKVKVTNLKNSSKFQIFIILKQTLHATHLLKLLDKICKYEMDLMSIVEDKERTRICPHTDRRTRWNQYTSLSNKVQWQW